MIHPLSSLAVVLTVISGAIIFTVQHSLAQTIRFVCKTQQQVPATVIQIDQGEIVVIRWNSRHISEPPTAVEDRCQQVAEKLQNHHDNNTLGYITVRNIDSKVMACIAQVDKGRCIEPLFALKTDINPQEAIQEILGVRVPNNDPIDESTESLLYIY